MRGRHLALSAVAFAALAFAAPATATDLVTNGGFETGDFTGWTTFGQTDHEGVDTTSAHSGVYGAYFGQVGGTGGIQQTLSTTPGQTYTVSFWLANGGGTPNSFDFSFDGISELSFVNDGGFTYTFETFDLTASTASTLLSFTFRQDPSYWRLDDVSVQAAVSGVPEPATWAMMILGFGAAGFVLRRRKATATAALA